MSEGAQDFVRVPVCGLIPQYSATIPMPGPDEFSVLRERLTLHGFVHRSAGGFPTGMGEWVGGGRLR
jgi:NADPH-dependent curcumin reductase CurA